jgi:hypothetical protein
LHSYLKFAFGHSILESGLFCWKASDLTDKERFSEREQLA